LPSAQGMSFYTDSGLPENSLVSILDSNRLKLDSYVVSGDRQVYYYQDGVFDHTIDLEIELRAKILYSGDFGLFVVAYNPNVSSNFVISKTIWRIYGIASGNSQYDFSQSFNTFKYKGYASTNSYEFFINGSLVASGTRPSGYSGNQFYFGDEKNRKFLGVFSFSFSELSTRLQIITMVSKMIFYEFSPRIFPLDHELFSHPRFGH
jgi:hypothetical protein